MPSTKGMVATATRTILENLDRIPNEDQRTKVAVIAYDTSLYFFSMPVGLSHRHLFPITHKHLSQGQLTPPCSLFPTLMMSSYPNLPISSSICRKLGHPWSRSLPG